MALNPDTIQRLQGFVDSDKFRQVNPETQKRVLNLLDRQSQPGAPSGLVESGNPVFNAEQVIPKSPLSAVERFRLGTATQKGRRDILKKKFGTVIGKEGREVVPGPEGLQAVDPKGFRFRDIPGDVAEFLPEIPNIAGQITGSVIGSVGTKTPHGAIAGRAIGGGVGAGVGEIIKSGLGKTLGTRPDSSVADEISNAVIELGKAGSLEVGFAGLGRVAGGAGPFAKEALSSAGKLGRGIIQSLGRAKKMTSEWLENRVKTVGSKEVFRPEKLSPDYGFKELVPRIQRGFGKSLNNLTKQRQRFFKEKLGVTDDTLQVIKNKSFTKVQKLKDNLNNSFAPIRERIQFNLSNNLRIAGKEFDEVLRATPENQTIDAAPFVNSIRKSLREAGVMTKDNQFRNIDQSLLPGQVKKLIRIHNEVVPGVVGEGRQRATGNILLSDYFRFRTILDDAVKGTRSDRFIFEANDGLVKGAVKSINGLKEVNKKYATAKQLFDDFTPESKTGEKVLSRFNKLTKAEKDELKRLDAEVPFLDDVKGLNAAQEIDEVIKKNLSAKKIESLFSQGTNETKGSARSFLKEFSESMPRENQFFADYRDWIAHLDLQDVGAYASNAGIIRSLSEGAESKFLQFGIPIFESGRRGIRRVGETVGTPIRRAGQATGRVAPTLIRSLGDEE